MAKKRKSKSARSRKLAAAMRKRWKSPAYRAKMKKAARKSAKSRKRVRGRFKNPVFAFRTRKVYRLKKGALRSRKSFKRGRGWFAIKARKVTALPGRPKKGMKRWVRWKRGGHHAVHRNPAGISAKRFTHLEKQVRTIAKAQHAIMRHLGGQLHQLPAGRAKFDVMRGLKAYQSARAREEAFHERAAALEAGARRNPSRGRKHRKHRSRVRRHRRY